ncbi:hypothetical protein [Paraburkholderia sp. CI3]|uniref:hypothetical protein n=1 Tax=Paraburkholderia sp. CI3 TaxID=2991060 RepID=UPI003D1DD3F8
MRENTRHGAVKSKSKEHFSRHPIFVTIVGFILTGLLGTMLTFKYNSLSTEKEHAIARISSRRQSVIENYKALLEFPGAATHLLNELVNDSPREMLLNSFKLYQESAAHAYSAIPGSSFLIYQAGPIDSSGHTRYDRKSDPVVVSINRIVNERLLPLLQYSDACITTRFAYWGKHGQDAGLNDCGDEIITHTTYPNMPRTLTSRIQAYANCANTFASVLLELGTDPDEELYRNDIVNVEILKIIDQDSQYCPSLGTPVPPHSYSPLVQPGSQ